MIEQIAVSMIDAIKIAITGEAVITIVQAVVDRSLGRGLPHQKTGTDPREATAAAIATGTVTETTAVTGIEIPAIATVKDAATPPQRLPPVRTVSSETAPTRRQPTAVAAAPTSTTRARRRAGAHPTSLLSIRAGQALLRRCASSRGAVRGTCSLGLGNPTMVALVATTIAEGEIKGLVNKLKRGRMESFELLHTNSDQTTATNSDRQM